MKRISTKLKDSSVYQDFIIYEHIEEVEKHNIKVVPLLKAKPKDYVKTDNGFYLPLISRKEYVYKKNPNIVNIRLQFPRCQYTYTLYIPTKKITRNPFNYISDPNLRMKTKFNVKVSLVAEIMAKGAPIHDAIRIVYPNSSSREIDYKAKAFVRNEEFIEYFMEKANMKELIESLEKAGLTYDFLAQKLKESIDKKNNLASIQFAYNVVSKAKELDKQERKAFNTKEDIGQLDDSLYEKLKDKN